MNNISLTETIKKQIPNVFLSADLPKFGEKKSGKVRDLYFHDDKIIIITTDRISAFDAILNQGIPYKGQALNQTSEFWFERTKKFMKNHIIAVPDPNVMIAQKCRPIELEVIIRGYLTGSAWRRYKYLKEQGLPLVISGVEFPPDLRKDEKLPEPVFTPTTKAKEGHDVEITPKEIVEQGIVSQEVLDRIINVAFKLYEEGNAVVSKQGGILVDTKFEFGYTPDNELVLIDEVLTADSSRYWLKEFYKERFEQGVDQKGLDKEYVRNWLREQGFTGDGTIPDLPEDVIVNAALNVINAYELITGQKFKPAEVYASNERLSANLEKYFK
ncbi:phosphoribosylaminoimidazolesuccinocarboxamide synthase [Candidatus Heimdallarchaeota archaeon]|nr:MAG: phosphoribosylaminoimidazolesuccinocarboxamide synthase [Candidatus Gerdarchaeota archaeon]RLI74219.1 MAG: phosphoribosylaminoimidazolesuccinocarboxamide synthase [Candidatus Heimdallarchaeota archaeon]